MNRKFVVLLFCCVFTLCRVIFFVRVSVCVHVNVCLNKPSKMPGIVAVVVAVFNSGKITLVKRRRKEKKK